MKKTVSVADAKAHLSEILGKVAAGQEIVITRRGEPVARIAPVKKALKPLLSLKEFRAKIPFSAESGKELIRRMRDEGY